MSTPEHNFAKEMLIHLGTYIEAQEPKERLELIESILPKKWCIKCGCNFRIVNGHYARCNCDNDD